MKSFLHHHLTPTDFVEHKAKTFLDWLAVIFPELPSVTFTHLGIWFLGKWLALMLLTPGKLFGYVCVIPFSLTLFGMQERALKAIAKGIVKSPPIVTFLGNGLILAMLVPFTIYFLEIFIPLFSQEDGIVSMEPQARNYLYTVSLFLAIIFSLIKWLIKRYRRPIQNKSTS